MRFNIHGNKIKVTEAIQSYIEEKIGKLDKYFENPNDMTANVAIRVNGIDQIVEVTIPTKGAILRGEDQNKDLYAAIDLVSEKIERQIRKNKTRLNKRTNKGFQVDFVIDFEVTEEEQDNTSIVKRKAIEMKPMSEEEAILQMNLLGHEFFVFEEAETGVVSVLYRRKDGNYGIIETK